MCGESRMCMLTRPAERAAHSHGGNSPVGLTATDTSDTSDRGPSRTTCRCRWSSAGADANGRGGSSARRHLSVGRIAESVQRPPRLLKSSTTQNYRTDPKTQCAGSAMASSAVCMRVRRSHTAPSICQSLLQLPQPCHGANPGAKWLGVLADRGRQALGHEIICRKAQCVGRVPVRMYTGDKPGSPEQRVADRYTSCLQQSRNSHLDRRPRASCNNST